MTAFAGEPQAYALLRRGRKEEFNFSKKIDKYDVLYNIIILMTTYIDKDDIQKFINYIKKRRTKNGFIYFNIKYTQQIYDELILILISPLALIIKDYIDEHILIEYKCTHRSSLFEIKFITCENSVINYEPIYFDFSIFVLYKKYKQYEIFAKPNSFSIIKQGNNDLINHDSIKLLNYIAQRITGEKHYICEPLKFDMLCNFELTPLEYKNNKYICKINNREQSLVTYEQVQDDYIVMNVLDIIHNLVYHTIENINIT